MKKLIVSILAVLYLGTSTGATVHLHYCMDKLAGWTLWGKDGDNCSKCGMSKEQKKETKGCCKDEHKQLKLKTDQKTTEDFQLLQTQEGTISSSYVELPLIDISSTTEECPISHAPPGIEIAPIYILHCTFRI